MMNPYGYSGMDQPAVPPRRKRSLSTSRSDYVTHDPVGMAFQSNRIGRRNFSTDHIPGGCKCYCPFLCDFDSNFFHFVDGYSGISKPIGSSYSSGSQQALSGSSMYGGNGGYNGFQNYGTRIPFGNANLPQGSLMPNQFPARFPHQPYQQGQAAGFSPAHQFQSPGNQSQIHANQRQPPYNSFGSNLNNLGRTMSSEQPMPIPRFMNPYAVPSPKVTPVRAHQDYLKYAQPNVHYNPYQSQFSPTLMARPDIRPALKPEPIPTFQTRDRSPYSSVSLIINFIIIF